MYIYPIQLNIKKSDSYNAYRALSVRTFTTLLAFVTVFTTAFHALPQPQIDHTTGELSLGAAVQKAYASGTTTIFLTAGTSWTVPSDWNDSANTIEVIGAGGGGARGASGSPWGPGSGGGGGGYAKASNITLTPDSSVTVSVGSGGTGATSASSNGSDGGDTYICNSTSNCASLAGSAVVVGAEGGAGGVFSSASDPAGGAGGGTANAVGDVKYAGGTGGDGVVAFYNGGGGGGGAAGPNGAGGAGGAGEGNGSDASGGGGGGADGGGNGADAAYRSGGAGGNNKDGSGGGAAGSSGSNGGGGGGGGPSTNAGNGGDGQVLWTQTSDSATAGPGGGGGSTGDGASGGGGDGGTYGGGGGGTSEGAGAAAGDGGQGIIVIQYTPSGGGGSDTTPPTPSTMLFSSAPTATSTSSIGMTSVTATDASSTPVSYNFTAVTADCGSDLGTGGTTSGWQSSASYFDTGLQPNHCYGYTVQARDSLNNTNTVSSASSTYTLASVPGPVTFSNTTYNSVTISNAQNGNPTTNPTTYFAIYATSSDPNWHQVYITAAGGTTTTQTWLSDTQIDNLTLSGLQPQTEYEFVSVAKNADNILTASSTLSGFATPAQPVGGGGNGETKRIFINSTASTTWTVPDDWNSASNTIEVIGGGGGGGEGSGSTLGSGGGGGAYSKSVNVTLTAGNAVGLKVGGGGAVTTAGEDTYICDSTSNCASIAGTAVIAGAKGGGAGQTGTDIDGGAGGVSTSGYAEADGVEDASGSQKYSGGTGGHAGWNGGSGGGGAAGPDGAGANGGNATSWGGGGGGGNGGGSVGSNSSTAVGANGGGNASSTGGGTGGNGANGTAGSIGGGGGGGADNYSGGDGGNGIEWITAGSGGGGGGAGSGGGAGDGGLYGAGGGGESDYGAGAGVGAQGVIVITYTTVVDVTGSSTIADHTSGQVADAFNGLNKTNEPLFAFRVTPNSGNATVTNMVIDLTGIQQVDANDFSSIRLLKDNDNDALYDAGDTVLDSGGVMNMSGQTGTLTFTSDFAITTATNYLVVANWNMPVRGASMTVQLQPADVTITDTNGVQDVTGTVSSIQHNRNSSSGGGGSSSIIGGEVPVGDGDVGGGEEGSGDSESGGAIDTNTGGGMIGSETDYFWPTAIGTTVWTNPGNAYDHTDGTYASANSAITQVYTTFNDSVPGGDTIGGVSVKLEISGTTAAGDVDVELSWDNGTSWTSAKTSPTVTTTDTVVTLGASSDKWGHNWTPAEIGNFQLRVTANPSSNTIQIDGIQVKIHHQAAGGSAGSGDGGGGGGAI